MLQLIQYNWFLQYDDEFRRMVRLLYNVKFTLFVRYLASTGCSRNLSNLHICRFIAFCFLNVGVSWYIYIVQISFLWVFIYIYIFIYRLCQYSIDINNCIAVEAMFIILQILFWFVILVKFNISISVVVKDISLVGVLLPCSC